MPGGPALLLSVVPAPPGDKAGFSSFLMKVLSDAQASSRAQGPP